MFALCDRMDKEGSIGTYSGPNELPDRVRKEKEAEWLTSFEHRVRRERTGESHAELWVK